MLEASEIRQWFRSGFWLKPTPILHDVSLKVPEGSVTGFVGPNGAGKTTLIHLIVGIRRPKSGRVTWKGVETREPAARGRIGYLPERPYFHEHLTGRQLLRYFGRLSSLTERDIAARTPRLLARVGLGDAGDRELRTYSKGMLQRIGIAQALLHDPELLVLDEPMSGLDPVGRAEMREIILDLGREGRTVFFSSHIIPDVESICDRVAIIQQGRITRNETLDRLLQDDSRRTRIRFLAQNSNCGRFGAIQAPDGSWEWEIPQDRVNQSLTTLLNERATILGLEPRHRSLEEVFSRRPK